MKRHVLCLAAVGALRALSLVVWWPWRPLLFTRITMENARKVDVGMGLDEAEFILGGPERDDSTGPTSLFYYDVDQNSGFHEVVARGPMPGDDRHRWFASHRWFSDHARILIGLTADGRVQWIIATPCQPERDNVLNMTRRWLRL